MAYQVLARKWRPQRFDDVIGQRGVTQTLRNAIARERVAQAFVFAGPRGVGKTTTARILARALNCVEGPTADPCGECDACREVAEGRDIDVLEIDAATHTQVDNVREVIIAGLSIVPVRDRYKVFIIDEVHQLSSSSFNALLKSVEEPPPHVVFIMATTLLDKIPDTILSRSQVFEFRTIGTAAIAEQLRTIVETEQVSVDEAGLALVARTANGSMRDAQSALDQVIAFAGDSAGAGDVSAVLGLVGRDAVLEMAETVAAETAERVFDLAGRFVEAGYDLRSVCRELARLVRDLMVLKVDARRISDPEIALDAERDRLQALADRFSREDLLRGFDVLSRAEFDIRNATQPRYHFEMAMLRWIHLRALVPLTDLLGGAGRLEPTPPPAAPAGRRPARAGSPPQRARPAPQAHRTAAPAPAAPARPESSPGPPAGSAPAASAPDHATGSAPAASAPGPRYRVGAGCVRPGPRHRVGGQPEGTVSRRAAADEKVLSRDGGRPGPGDRGRERADHVRLHHGPAHVGATGGEEPLVARTAGRPGGRTEDGGDRPPGRRGGAPGRRDRVGGAGDGTGPASTGPDDPAAGAAADRAAGRSRAVGRSRAAGARIAGAIGAAGGARRLAGGVAGGVRLSDVPRGGGAAGRPGLLAARVTGAVRGPAGGRTAAGARPVVSRSAGAVRVRGAAVGEDRRPAVAGDGGPRGADPARCVPGRDQGSRRDVTMNIQKMMQQAQQMQDNLQKQLKQATVEATAGGGMVTVVMNGVKEVQSLSIDPEVVSPDDVEMLQDLIVAAVTDAQRRVDELVSQRMGGMMGGLKMPGLS